MFIKNVEAKSYYFVDDVRCEPVGFTKMAKNLQVSPRLQGMTPLKGFHYEQVGKAEEHYDKELSKIVQLISRTKIENVTDKKAIRLLKGWFDKGVISKEVYRIFKKIFEDGRIQNMGKKIKALAGQSAHEVVMALEQLQAEYSLQERQGSKTRIKREIEVILSETFIKA